MVQVRIGEQAHYFFFLAPPNWPITGVYVYMYSTHIYKGHQQATGGQDIRNG